ncbi:MAG: NAD-dependent epimerase/dehydratase family protein [Bacteroidota bacterium]|nr:NAD-dependent epimerase/dehydratase family protein [Bacteroidota bacterium]
MDRRDFKGKTILVVGGAGFVGSNLAHRLVGEAPAKLIVVDNLLSADIGNVPTDPCVDFRFGSITSDRILQDLPDTIHFVFHLSTYHGNQSSMHDPLADHENNTLTTLKLLERLKDVSGLEAVVYSSAGCTVAQKTFDEAKPTTEDDPVSLYLDSPYQMSKIFGEFYGNYYWMRHGIPFIKARFQNVYGPREILGAGQWRGTPATVWRNVTPTFIWKALHNQALPLEKGGVATRDFIFVDDIVDGLIACALKGKEGGVYNIASGVETSIKDLADTINRLTGNTAAVAVMGARQWDRSGKRFGETSKAERELGFSPRVSLEDGLARTVKWTRENMAVIERCIAQHARYFDNQSLSS